MREITAERGGVLDLGRQGEHLATRVRFPVGDWPEEQPEGRFQLLFRRCARRPGTDCGQRDCAACEMAAPRPMEIERAEDQVLWTLTRSETVFPGSGQCELLYYVGERLEKSETWSTRVLASLSGGPEEPPAEISWVERVLAAGMSAEASETAAAASAEEAAAIALQAARQADRAAAAGQAAEAAAVTVQVAAQGAGLAADRAEEAMEAAQAARNTAVPAANRAENGALRAEQAADRSESAAAEAETEAETARDQEAAAAASAESAAGDAERSAQHAEQAAAAGQSALSSAESAQQSAQSAGAAAARAEEDMEAARAARNAAVPAANRAENAALRAERAAAAFATDDTLTQADQAADAAAVGARADSLQGEIDALEEALFVRRVDLDTTAETGKTVYSTNGAEASSSNYMATSYLPIPAGAAWLHYLQCMSTTTGVTSGIAFYDAERHYLEGVATISRAQTAGARDNIVPIPAEAAYVRLSFWNPTLQVQHGTPDPYAYVLLGEDTALTARLDNALTRHFSVTASDLRAFCAAVYDGFQTPGNRFCTAEWASHGQYACLVSVFEAGGGTALLFGGGQLCVYLKSGTGDTLYTFSAD